MKRQLQGVMLALTFVAVPGTAVAEINLDLDLEGGGGTLSESALTLGRGQAALRWTDGDEGGLTMINYRGHTRLSLGNSPLGLSWTGGGDVARIGDHTVGSYHEELRVGLSYIELRQHARYQGRGEFDDWYWRRSRGVTELGGGFSMTMVHTGFPEGWVDFFTVDFEAGALLEDEAEEGTFVFDLRCAMLDISMDDWDPRGDGWSRSVPFALTVLSVDLEGTGLAYQTRGPQTRSLRAQHSHIGFFDMDGYSLYGPLYFGASLGWDIMEPAYVMTTTETTNDSGETEFINDKDGVTAQGLSATGSLTLAPNRDISVTFGGGTFERIEPTGFGVDHGYQLFTDLRWEPVHTVRFRTRGTWIEAHRALNSPFAGPWDVELTPEGSHIELGRVESSVEMPFGDHISLRSRTWLERTDRPDPITAGASENPTVPIDSWGIDLTLAVSLR